MTEKMAEFLDVLMGFRKFLAFMFVFIASVVFLVDGHISGSNFADIIKSAFVAFVAANGVEHFTSMAKDYLASKVAPPIKDNTGS